MNWYPATNLVQDAGDYRIAGCLSSKRSLLWSCTCSRTETSGMRPSFAQARAAFQIHRETSAARGSPRVKRSWPSSCMRRCHYLKQQTEIALDPTLHSRGNRPARLSARYLSALQTQEGNSAKFDTSPHYRLRCGLEEFDRIAVRIFQLNLFAAGSTGIQSSSPRLNRQRVTVLAGGSAHGPPAFGEDARS